MAFVIRLTTTTPTRVIGMAAIVARTPASQMEVAGVVVHLCASMPKALFLLKRVFAHCRSVHRALLDPFRRQAGSLSVPIVPLDTLALQMLPLPAPAAPQVSFLMSQRKHNVNRVAQGFSLLTTDCQSVCRAVLERLGLVQDLPIARSVNLGSIK